MRRMASGLLPLLAIPLVFTAFAPAPPADAQESATNPWPDRRVLNIAHQGGAHEAPANTLFAMKTAVRAGADMLELDVRATADGKLVAIHDGSVQATTSGSGQVDELTLAQLRKLDAAHWFVPGCGSCHDRPVRDYVYRGYATGARPLPPQLDAYRPSDFRVPTVRRILETFPRVWLDIEIKATEPDTKPYEKTLATLLTEYHRSTDTIVVSFDGDAIDRFKPYAPMVSTAPATGQIIEFWLSTQGPLSGMRLRDMHALQVPRELNGSSLITRDFVDDSHLNDLAVHVWTVDDRKEMEELVELGVDGIITNRPTLLADVLGDSGASSAVD